MKGNYSMNLHNLNYHIDVLVNHFDTKVIEQYLKEIANYGTLNANIDADLIASGSYRDAENINLKGRLAINEFHFGKKINDDYLSFDKVVINMNDVNPKMKKYFIDSVILIHPYFKFEQYDKSNNLATMFGVNASNVSSAKKDAIQFNLIFTIGEYIKKLSKNFLHSDFKVNKLGIYKCDLRYNDYSLSEKFSIELNPLFIYADSVYKNHNRINLFLKSGINPFGYSTVALSINPNDTADFDLQYHLQKLPAALFNPYIIKYTSFPLNRGTIELKGNWQVRNGNIKSNNHLVILDPRISKRIRNIDNRWLPLPLMMYFVRERGNVIDYEIPITGNLRNPNFHLRDVVFDILGNIFIKPPTIPYRIEVKNIETEIEKSITLNWEIGASKLADNEIEFVIKLAKYLKSNPNANISVQPQYYAAKETEHLLLFEAKKKYFLFIKHKSHLNFTINDSLIVTKMSIKDSLFMQYLNKHTNDSLLFSVQEKCNQMITANLINKQFQYLNEVRMKNFLSYFNQCNVAKQIIILRSVNLIPYNGQSIYKMNYNGKIPDDLSNAYQKLDQLNDEMPRSKFKKQRKKNEI